MDTALDFGNLWPRFWELFSGELPPNTAAGFSTIVVVVIITMTVYFLFYAAFHFRKANRRVSFYRKTLEPYESDELLAKRDEITKKMIKNPEYQGIWEEFDESLVDFRGELHNTLDASHFFNVHSLAHSLSDNRLIAAIPGLLTAMGVIGTFIGLQVGLGEISGSGLGTSLTGVDEINRSIGNLISSATIAFMTSVWGVGASVLFNFIEKVLERAVRASVFQLQLRIDGLYRRLTPERSLSDIENHSRESREAMRTLAEKIGDRMQEALVESTDKIKDGMVDGLQAILGPQLNAASENLQATIGGMKENFGRFMTQMDEQIQSIATANGVIMRQVQETLSKQIETQQEKALKRDQEFEKQMNELTGSQQNMKAILEEMLASQGARQNEVLGNISRVVVEIDGMAKRNQDVGKRLRETADAFLEQVGAVQGLSDSVRDASESLAGDVRDATKAAEKLAAQNQAAGERAEQVLRKTSDLSGALLKTASTMDGAARKTTEGLVHAERHFMRLTGELDKQVKAFSSSFNSLLEKYGEQITSQTRERLNQWNEQTLEFTSKMIDAVVTMHNILDEMEGRVGKR